MRLPAVPRDSELRAFTQTLQPRYNRPDALSSRRSSRLRRSARLCQTPGADLAAGKLGPTPDTGAC